MSFNAGKPSGEFDFISGFIGASSQDTAQSTMPLTPMMGADVFVATLSSASSDHFYNTNIDGVTMAATSMSEADVHSGLLLAPSTKEYQIEPALAFCPQFHAANSYFLPRPAPATADQYFSSAPVAAAPTHAYTHTGLGAHLQSAAATTSNSSTPLLPSFASPELCGIGILGQQAGMAESGFLSQMPYQSYAPASGPLLPSPLSHRIVDDLSALLYQMPITGPAQLPAEPLFLSGGYADMGSSFGVDNIPAVVPSAPMSHMKLVAPLSGPFGEQVGANTYHSYQREAARLAQSNQGLQAENGAVGHVNGFASSTPTYSAGPSAIAPLSQSFAAGPGDTALLSAGNSCNMVGNDGVQAIPAGVPNHYLPGAIRNSGRFARLRPGRSISISEPSRARSTSPAHALFGPTPHSTAHPYFPSNVYQSLSGAMSPKLGAAAADMQGGRQSSAQHSSVADAGNSYLDIAQLNLRNSSPRPVLQRSYSGPQTRPRHHEAKSVLSSPSTPVVNSESASDGLHSSDEALSEDGATGDISDAGHDAKGAGNRIPLTAAQREIFFRWLYQNINDPKPKGSERDRLRCIGNMTRERFKTWFANARRRYFSVTVVDGVQRYTMNTRFIVACERANIKLD
ncbi:hypothetical protein H4R26_004124 [Coemansia thaxteri]|uniref:KN homeodomain domain-containing protein n=1 Tax=Coemansia thaxteri TaxID=2663907 RepID=A0A9W8B9Z6_9FUNG|nr:hypothetical protein H4R26_004124 [Coemansia thaxteri]KAJ2486530.1 hypothetical protein EV174_001046 [Coemansia sp. RSA 2320]